jgi:hypothetical protein
LAHDDDATAPEFNVPQPAERQARIRERAWRRFGQASREEKFYSIAEVHSSLRRLRLPYDVDCWGFALYSSRTDFDRHHRSTGERCDYDSMRGQMIDALAEGAWSLFDIDLSWLEWPDIDLSSIFDFIDIG